MEIVKVVDIITKEDAESFDMEELVGVDAPYAYHINYQAHGYAKFIIDQKSLKAFEEKLSKIESSMSRKHLYMIMNDMVLSSHLTGAQLLEICKKQIAQDTAAEVITAVLRSIIPTIIKRYTPTEYYAQCHHDVFEMLVDNILPAGHITDTPTIHTVLDACITSIRNEDHYAHAIKWLDQGFVVTT